MRDTLHVHVLRPVRPEALEATVIPSAVKLSALLSNELRMLKFV